MSRYFNKILVGFVLISLAGCGGLIMQAEIDLATGNYDKAIQTYEEYLAKNPDNARAIGKYGYALLKTDRIDDSILQFNKALELKPGDPFAIVHLGMAYLNKGEFGQAAKTWNMYSDKKMPLVEKEVKRLLTTVLMAHAQQEAENALAAESKIRMQAPEANTLAVGYFKDISPDQSLRAFQKGLTAILITDISKIGAFKVVERVKLQALLEEMKLGQTGIVDEKTAPRVGRLLRVESMVTGNLTKGSIEAAVGVVSTSEGGRKKGSATGRVEQQKFFELPPMLIEKIFNILQVKLTKEQRKEIGIPHTKSYEAFINYGNCLHALDLGKWQQARDYCAKAIQKDPKFILARKAYESTPSDTAPSIDSIKSSDAPRIARAAEQCLDDAFTAQSDADEREAAEEMESGSGGSGGGGGH